MTYKHTGDMLICMRTTVHLPDDLLVRAKQKAAADGRTLTSLIEEGLRSVLNSGANAASARVLPRVSPPISVHSGGLLPGLDPDKLNTQMQELEDLEYVERLRKGFE